MKNKNKELLQDFTKYCEEHPEQRFWQALKNWSGVSCIVVSREQFTGIIEDTYNWEGKNR